MLAYAVLSLILISGIAGDKLEAEDSSELQDCSQLTLNHTDVFYNFFTREGFLHDQRFAHIGSSKIHSSYHHINKVTKIIVHGWGDSSRDQYTNEMIQYYLQTEDVNVIVVDWSKYSKVCDAKSTATKVRTTVAHSMNIMMKTLLTRGSDPITYHLIGWGSGAHIAGVAGKLMHPRMVGRITALDYKKNDEYHGVAVLETGDAHFVDVIHTSKQSHSKYGRVGHVKFYPQGGEGKQPGCKEDEDPICSRLMSLKYFVSSIMEPTLFVGRQCDSYENYKAGKCDSNPANPMGEYANPKYPGDFYLTVPESYLSRYQQ